MLESGKKIIPVFHHVKPTELRRTDGEGVYATSLRNLQEKTNSDSRPRYNSKTIKKWRKALLKVADKSGLDLDAFKGDEGELVDKIVEAVLKDNVKTPLNVARYPTGLADKVQDFETNVLLQQCSGRVQILGITGLGGVGKTTLALELFNRKRSNCRNSYFLSDVRENAKKSLHSMQSQLLKGLFQLDLHIENMHVGSEELKKSLSSRKVLLVLDDVDHPDQVFALLPQLNDLHHDNELKHDSLILITSRDKDVLKRSGVQESSIYQLSGLNTERSRELFCSHAFCNPRPLRGFEHLVDNFLKACNGLPLSLKVLGGLLYGHTDKSYWQSKLKALRKKLPGDIQKSLQISYDALEEEEKQIFLDIACFFIGIDRDTAIIVWDGSGWDGKLGFQSLMDKCLVEVYMEDNYEQGVKMQHLIRMHDHLRDMGRDLANTPGFPCRLWCGTKHMEDLLQQSSSEATKVRGIRMSRWEHYDERSDTDEYDERASFSRYKMKKLQILDIQEGDDDLLKCLLKRVDSPNLLYLRWRNCPCSSLPPHIPMEKLMVLDVEGSKLKTLWKEDLQIFGGALERLSDSFGNLWRLEHINLSYCRALERLPDSFGNSFGNLWRLKHINLSYCRALERLPDSFGNLLNLEHINLYDCVSLERLPDSFGKLSRLQHIDLSYCSALERLPDSFGNLSSLEHINLSYCSALERLPDSFGDLSSLERINLSCCRALERLPDSFGNLSRLERIDLPCCSALKRLPDSFGNLSRLQQQSINLSYCQNLERLPDSFGNLSRLERIDLSYCSALERLPDSFGNLSRLERIDLSYCSALERLPDSFGDLSRLEHINLSWCSALERLPDSFGNLSRLERIDLSYCSALERLPDSFGNLIKLEYIGLSHCHKLTIPGGTFRKINPEYVNFPEWRIEVFPPQIAHKWSLLLWLINSTEWPSATGEACHLERLVLETPFLEALPPSFGNDLRNLKCLELRSCRSLKRLPDSFLLLNQLVDLRVEDCSPELHFKAVEGENETLTDSGGERTSSNLERFLPRLQRLTLRNTHISEVSFPTCVCPDLQYLDISNCPDLVEVTLPNGLRSLNLYECSELMKIGAPFPTGVCANLQDLRIMKCNDLMPNASFHNASFKDLACVMTSRHGLAIKVEISNFSKLRKIGGSFPTGVCPSFQDLSIQHCKNLVELEILPTAIQHLQIRKCKNLVELEILPTVIQHLKIRKCEKLVEFDCPNLQPLEIWPVDCQELVEVGTLPNALLEMQLINCPKMREIEQLCGFTKLRTLDKCLLRLQHLELDNLQISKVSFPTGVCPNLQHLHIRDCEDLIEVRTLPNALIKLQLDRCPKLKLIRIEELAQVMQLREMRVRFCDGLEEMVGVGYLKSLEVMQVTDCMQLKIIQGLEQLTQLRELDFSYCFELEELLGVGHLKSLEVFKATMCQRLKSIRGLEQLTLLRLRELDISNCSKLETLS